MSKVKDGGPAFPRPGFQNDNEEGVSQDGMSLRDWYAGKAMESLALTAITMEKFRQAPTVEDQASVVYQFTTIFDHLEPWDHLAATAYQMADAMIKARGKEARHE